MHFVNLIRNHITIASKTSRILSGGEDPFDEFEDGYGTDDYDHLDFEENWN